MTKRFMIGFKQDELRGHRGVYWTVYRSGRLTEGEYRAFIRPPLQWDDKELQYQAECFFGEEELPLVRRWFAEVLGIEVNVTQQEASDAMVCRLNTGPDSIVEFDERDDWPFDFGATGFYDLRNAEAGPYVDDAGLMAIKISKSDNGTVVKLPPF